MPRLPDQAPVEMVDPKYQGDDTRVYTHPAFGQVVVSRVSGSTTLYGSDFVHHSYVALRIYRSRLHRSLSRDWPMLESLRPLIEIKLSEAQWAAMVSSFGLGEGTRCTIEAFNGEEIPGLPLRTETEEYQREFQDDLERAAGRVDAAIATIQGALGEKVSKKVREEILQELHGLKIDMDDSMKFVARSFEKHMEQTVEKAKVEVHGYVHGVIHQTGLSAIAGQGPLQLGAGAQGAGSQGTDEAEYEVVDG